MRVAALVACCGVAVGACCAGDGLASPMQSKTLGCFCVERRIWGRRNCEVYDSVFSAGTGEPWRGEEGISLKSRVW